MNKLRTAVVFGVIAVLLGVAVFVLNSQEMQDRLSAIGYTPTSEMAGLKDALDLTGKGEAIFLASKPELENADNFNYHCSSYNSSVSVLGCYSNGAIYVYNITEESLNGIKESTVAHELLHAAWRRMSEDERKEVSAMLDDVYAKNAEELEEELKTYDATDRTDELHSRIGVQIADLPEKLEEHYAKYFNDQDKVVKYYEKYSANFKELARETEKLKGELDVLKTEFDTKTAEYQKEVGQLNSEVEEFNKCAETVNCFKSNEEFVQKKAGLEERQRKLDEYYAELERMVGDYNQKVEKYNNSVLRTQKLQNAMNSNGKVNSI